MQGAVSRNVRDFNVYNIIKQSAILNLNMSGKKKWVDYDGRQIGDSSGGVTKF